MAAHHVADGVAAGFAGRHVGGGEQAQDLGRLLELHEVELHVLAGRDVTPPTRVRLRDVRERLELFRCDAAVRDLHAQHLVPAALALSVDAVIQPEDAERVLVDPSVEVVGDGAFEDVELVGDDRFELSGREIADVDRHRAAPKRVGGGRTAGREGAGRQRARTRQSSSRTSCGVRPMKMLAAPTTRRIMRITLRRSARKCQ